MFRRQVQKQKPSHKLENAVGNALRCLYSDSRLDKFWKEAILEVFISCFK